MFIMYTLGYPAPDLRHRRQSQSEFAGGGPRGAAAVEVVLFVVVVVAVVVLVVTVETIVPVEKVVVGARGVSRRADCHSAW